MTIPEEASLCLSLQDQVALRTPSSPLHHLWVAMAQTTFLTLRWHSGIPLLRRRSPLNSADLEDAILISEDDFICLSVLPKVHSGEPLRSSFRNLHFSVDRQFCVNPLTKHAQCSIVLTRPPSAVGSLAITSNQIAVDEPLSMLHAPSKHWRCRSQLEASRFLNLRQQCSQLATQFSMLSFAGNSTAIE